MSKPSTLLLLALLSACAAEEPGVDPGGARADSAAAGPAAGAEPAGWTVSPAGAGPVRVGATLAELAPLLEAGVDTAAIGDRCDYPRVAGAPDSVGFMVEGRRVVRVDVFGGPTPTAEGARVGDAEERIRALYPGVRRMPHKYTDGAYLVALPGAPGDTLGRIVFETDGARVTSYRAGVFPPVEYVERCG
jgi:hypothetical protein